MAAPDPERARLLLFGPVRLLARSGSDVTPRGQKVLGLLALLALARDGRLARAAAASRLWSGSHDAKANLRQCLRELRRALDAAGPGILRTDDYELVLDRERLAVDALALERATAGVLDTIDDDCLLRDIEIADPLFDDWLVAERLRWRDRLHQALEALARARLAADDPARAIALASRLLAFEPTLEAAHRILMQGHAAQGNPSLALRQFELCHQSLKRELGVSPSAATLALRAAIARPPSRPQPQPATASRGASDGAEPGASPPPAAVGRHPPGAPVRIGLAAFRVLSPLPGDGIHAVIVSEAIGAALARSAAVAVIDESMPMAAPACSDSGVRRAAPAACTVDASVARLDNALRLTVRLAAAGDRRLLWAEHFRLETPFDDEALDRLARLIAARLERAALGRLAESAGSGTLGRPCSSCGWRHPGPSTEAVPLPAAL